MSQTPSSSDFVGSTTTDRLASKAHDTIDRVAPKVNRAEHEVRDVAAKTLDGAKQLQDDAMAATEENLRKMRSYAESNPLTTAGIALAVGFVLSALLRR